MPCFFSPLPLHSPVALLEAIDLKKSFNDRTVVNGVSLEVEHAEIVGLLGRNGAGKTTTFRMTIGMIERDAGRVIFNNTEVTGLPMYRHAQLGMGYLSQEPSIFQRLTCEQNLLAILETLKLSRKERKRKAASLLDQFSLSHKANDLARTCSGGERRKLEIARALVTDPKLILLDEPFSGLDPVNMRLLRNLIDEQHQSGKTVIFSTHVMYQAEQICDHIIMIHEGRKVLDDTLDDIRTRFDPRAIHIDPIAADGSIEAIKQLPCVSHTSQVENAIEVKLNDGIDTQDAMRSILQAQPLNRIEIKKPTLEDVFIEIVTGGDRGADAQQLRADLLAGTTNEEEAES